MTEIFSCQYFLYDDLGFAAATIRLNWKFSYLIKDQSKYDIQIPRKRNDKFFDKLRVANVPGINDNFEK